MNTSAGTNSNTNNSQPRKTANQNIQVYVRVRPLNARERCIRSSEVIEVVSPREIVTRHTLESKLTKKFTFDRTFGPESKQVDVYSTVVAPLIEEVLSGYNCTVFAYGQTGTGKTYTMVGTETAELKSSWEDDSDIGIIPRALSHLFDELRLMEVEFMMRISYLELYNEELCDLLSSDDNTKIRIFDDSTKKGSVIIQGLEEIPVHSKDDVYKLLEKGKERRKTATTLMNAQSSRSHTVFSIVVHLRENGMEGEELVKIGKLNLVDLAGSENVSKAGNEKGIRVRETVNINQSLLTLGRVITALVERTPHIPYRESKLTRLLQESLGGRTKTSIIATISPGHKDIEETLSTLEYAHRAKNIQNKPEVNQKLNKRTILKEYSDEIDKLKRDLAAARDKNGVYLAEETYSEMTLKMDSQTRELNEKMLLLKALKDELANKEKMFSEISMNLLERTRELQNTDEKLSETKGSLLLTKKNLHSTKRRYKEKKVLLQSHVKTEEVLKDQATQILQVADIATNDTQELHSNIARRKDVDQKIQTACDRFVARMNDNFELLDENLDTYQENQKMHTQLLLEEFANCTNVQKRLAKNSNRKIQDIKQICTESVKHQNDLSDQFFIKLNEVNDEHRTTLTNLFDELRKREQALREQIAQNLTDMETFNEEQKSALETMRHSVRQQLEQSSNDLRHHSQHIQQQITNLKTISQSNLTDLTHLTKQISEERDLASKEQSIINEFVQKMQLLQNERGTLTEIINGNALKLENNSKNSLQLLEEANESSTVFCQQHFANYEKIIENIDVKVNDGEVCIDKSVAKCATLKIQLSNLCHERAEQLNECIAKENSHCSKVKEISVGYGTNLKRQREHDDELFNSACIEVGTIVANEAQNLKAHVAVSGGFVAELQTKTQEYAKQYTKQINNCINDMAEFKQSELQTYIPTGQTPSKRDFAYPRILAATSPHRQIVKRFRQQNEWSDLDTTATIDEDSEGEAERYSVQEISETETLLNSTLLDSPNITKPAKRSNGNNKLGNTSQPIMRNSNGLPVGKSPNKSTPRYLSPTVSKENKENAAV